MPKIQVPKLQVFAAVALVLVSCRAGISTYAPTTSRTTVEAQDRVIGTAAPTSDDAGVRSGYVDLEVQLVSVEALMRYAGSPQPLVPASSLVKNGEGVAVFSIAEGPTVEDRFWYFTVSLQTVTVSGRTDIVASVIEGVTRCDQVVIDPPSTLTDHMKVRTSGEPEHEALDLGSLVFAGASPALLPDIWGGIVRWESDRVEMVWSYAGPTPPDGSVYRYETPDGLARTIAYRAEVRFWLPTSSLRADQPTGNVALVNPQGQIIAEATLSPFCP